MSFAIESNAAEGEFDTANVGTGKTVTVTISSDRGGCGQYTSPADRATADITAKGLTVDGAAAANKIYDATRMTAWTSAARAHGIVGTDVVSLNSAVSRRVRHGQRRHGQARDGHRLDHAGAAAGNYTVTSRPR